MAKHDDGLGQARKALGFTFDCGACITQDLPDVKRATFRAHKVLSQIVHDTTALEDNPFTFPEVQTLMDGITVGGHRVSDAEQVLNQADSWRRLLDLVGAGQFKADKRTACAMHGLAARNEALEWGAFRTGRVGVSGAKHTPPHWKDLDSVFERGMAALDHVGDVHIRAMCAFLFVSRNQFFWDGNKRTGRLLMNGILLSAGMDVITVPATKRLEFNKGMVEFYDSGNASWMLRFLSGCSLDNSLRIEAALGVEAEGCERAQAGHLAKHHGTTPTFP